MGMEDPVPQYTHFVESLKDSHPDLAYIHLVEPRPNGSEVYIPGGTPEGESNDFLRTIWSPRPFISAGGYNRSSALKVAHDKGDIIAFGRHFISNVSMRCLLISSAKRLTSLFT